MIPIYGFVQGDTLGLLLLAQHGETMQELADKLQQSARVRVAQRAHVRVVYKGRELDPKWTIEQAGIEALDRIDVVVRGERSNGW
jgi:Toluene-4-monooxygenase system protein B (TmoB)